MNKDKKIIDSDKLIYMDMLLELYSHGYLYRDHEYFDFIGSNRKRKYFKEDTDALLRSGYLREEKVRRNVLLLTNKAIDFLEKIAELIEVNNGT